jgi:hypothetical protein
MDTELKYQTQTQNDNKYLDFFAQNTFTISSHFNELLNKMCFIEGNNMILDYKIMKPIIMQHNTYDVVFEHLINVTKEILLHNEFMVLHICLKGLTITDMDKHRGFVLRIIKTFSEQFPNKLNVCNLYKTPAIFAQIFGLISMFIDKVTINKIRIVKSPPK